MQCFKPVYLADVGEVPCGKCAACRIARTRDWAIRLMHESAYWPYSLFATLTYDDAHLPGDFGLHKRDLVLMFKRLRKDRENKLKYFACGEYGETGGRPHYHAIIFGVRSIAEVEDVWPYGFCYGGTVTFDSCKYVAGYVQKKLSGLDAKLKYGEREAPFQLQSKGLGLSYVKEDEERISERLLITVKGQPYGLPRYYWKKVEHLVSDERRLNMSVEQIVKRDESLAKMQIDKKDLSVYQKAYREQRKRYLEAKTEQWRRK